MTRNFTRMVKSGSLRFFKAIFFPPKLAGAITTILTLSGVASAGSVRDFGAAGNGTSDDTAAIQRAIDATPVGGTLYFTGGTYRVTSPLLIRSNRTYQGQNNPVLLGYQGTGPGGYLLARTEYNGTRNLVIDGLTLDGGGIEFQGYEIPAENVHFTNNTLRNIVNTNPSWVMHRGLFIPSGMRSSTISGNTFQNIQPGGDVLSLFEHPDSSAISGWRLHQTEITDNRFDSVNQGISLQFDSIPANPGPFSNVVIARNTGVKIHRMGIETQSTTGRCDYMLVEDNSFGDFRNPYHDTFAYSFVHGGTGAIIRRNVALATPMAGPGQRFGLAFELTGDNVTLENNVIHSPLNNYSQGSWWWGVAIGHGSNFLVQNNILCGPHHSTGIGFEVTPSPSATIRGNIVSPVCAAATPTPR